jgi:hypothetical protein
MSEGFLDLNRILEHIAQLNIDSRINRLYIRVFRMPTIARIKSAKRTDSHFDIFLGTQQFDMLATLTSDSFQYAICDYVYNIMLSHNFHDQRFYEINDFTLERPSEITFDLKCWDLMKNDCFSKIFHETSDEVCTEIISKAYKCGCPQKIACSIHEDFDYCPICGAERKNKKVKLSNEVW